MKDLRVYGNRCVLTMTFLATTLSSAMLAAQNVTTWHNDINRTGWQQNETTLKQSNVSQTTFGLLWQWYVSGAVFAQPLAVANVSTQLDNCKPSCNLVFIATELDMLYAFNTAAKSPNPVWKVDLAGSTGSGNTAVDCGTVKNLGIDFGPCDAPSTIGTSIGITGTPVIDTGTNTLYVAAAVFSPGPATIAYDLFAVDITTGAEHYTPIDGTVTGNPPASHCATTYPSTGTVIFDHSHIQRSALLFLPSNGVVYVAFAPGGGTEKKNGWIFGYTYSNGIFSRRVVFNTTPYGTGGGIWQAGAGLASDGIYIYAATGNGTNYDPTSGQPPVDMGDTLLKINPSGINGFGVVDFYTPSNVFSYNNNQGLCDADKDFGSGGVLPLPTDFTYNSMNVVINADKQCNLYVANQRFLGGFNSNGGNNIQTLLTPHPKVDQSQGYWASPAYWKYGSAPNYTYMIYYSATTDNAPAAAPLPIKGYSLLTSGSSGPIPDPPTASTITVFCEKSPTPSGSWNGATGDSTTGIVWAIENQNKNNVPPTPNCADKTLFPSAALHAFDAVPNGSGVLTELYTSAHVQTAIGNEATFSTPTIFNGRVYMGTRTFNTAGTALAVDVFGLCGSQGCMP